MTLYNPAEPRVRPRVGAGRRRFDILTIGLHWATVTLIAGMFASAWLLLASDREHAVRTAAPALHHFDVVKRGAIEDDRGA